jgi:hypothetical protein
LGVFNLRGKPWSVDEERQLSHLVEEGKSCEEISRIMGKSRSSVKGKLFNSGLNSLIVATGVRSAVATTATIATTPLTPDVACLPDSASVGVAVDLKLPERLPSVEDELKVLAAAVEALRQPGLNRSEISRLHKVIQGAKVYQELFAKFVNYRGLETEVLELRRQYASENTKRSDAST